MNKLTMLLLLSLTLAGFASAQTTTQYNFDAGQTHNSTASTSKAVAEAAPFRPGFTVYDEAKDRLETGFPWTQFDFADGVNGDFCSNNVPPSWVYAPEPGLDESGTGLMATMSCTGMGLNGLPFSMVAILHFVSRIITFVNGGKGGSRLYYEKVWTLQNSSLDGTPSNVQITQ